MLVPVLHKPQGSAPAAITVMLDRPPSPDALRARRARWRRRNGLVPRRIDVDEHGLAEMLIASRRLTEAEALRSELQERELATLVADLIARWRHDVTRR
jgi:hypothetical protein